MNCEVRAFFEGLARRGYDKRLREKSGTIEYDFENDGTWRVRNEHGWVTVTEGQGDADCYIAGPVDDFLAQVRGEKDPITLVMQGTLRITGDWALANVAQRLFPATADQSWPEGDF